MLQIDLTPAAVILGTAIAIVIALQWLANRLEARAIERTDELVRRLRETHKASESIERERNRLESRTIADRADQSDPRVET